MKTFSPLWIALFGVSLAACSDASPPQVGAASSSSVSKSSVTATTWNFEDAPLGSVPSGTEIARGSWEIRELRDAPAGPRVLVQTAHNRGATFNLIVFAKPQLKDLDLHVQLKALAAC